MYSIVVINFFIILVWIHGVTGIPVVLDQTGVESDRLGTQLSTVTCCQLG